MTEQSEHRAEIWRGADGARIACTCKQWRAEPGDGLSNQRAAHRDHRAAMGEPRFPEPDVRQVIVPVGMFDVFEVIFAQAGYALGKVPHIDTPTYLPVEAPREDLAKIAAAARSRMLDNVVDAFIAHRDTDAIREGNHTQETE